MVVKPARLALARVSCIRGEGSMAGVPFLDSCIMQARSRRDLAEISPRYRICIIRTRSDHLTRSSTCHLTRSSTCHHQAEPVVDYLTRFSGLHPGDLDPSVSRHHITSMKATLYHAESAAFASLPPGCLRLPSTRLPSPPHGLSTRPAVASLPPGWPPTWRPCIPLSPR